MKSDTRSQYLTEKIKEALKNHEPVGGEQWWVDELNIDCAADELFWVIEKTLIEELGE